MVRRKKKILQIIFLILKVFDGVDDRSARVHIWQRIGDFGGLDDEKPSDADQLFVSEFGVRGFAHRSGRDAV